MEQSARRQGQRQIRTGAPGLDTRIFVSAVNPPEQVAARRGLHAAEVAADPARNGRNRPEQIRSTRSSLRLKRNCKVGRPTGGAIGS